MIPKKYQPHILGIDVSFMKELIPAPGVKEVDYEKFLNDAGQYLVIRQRHGLETNESILQLLPYILITQTNDPQHFKLNRDTKILSYRRGSGVGETRLVGNTSIGFGGHIDLEDVVFEDSIINLKETLEQTARRELKEELGIDQVDLKYVCMIRDTGNAVGRVHLGIVFLGLIPEDTEINIEEELNLTGVMTLGELIMDKHEDLNLENWSDMLVRHWSGK